jgi:polysaccharide biosynthesis/export protein
MMRGMSRCTLWAPKPMKQPVQMRKFLLMLLSSLLVIPAGAQVPVPPQPLGGTAAPPEPAGVVAPAPAAVGIQPSYVIGPGDVLQVFVWRNPELTITVPVRPDGRITTPLVEEMTASNKNAEQLARDIEKVLAEYVRAPQVNVIVVTPRGTQSEVKVVGQVKNPQGVPFREGMTVLDLVLAVGGLTDFAAGNRARIIREHDGKRTEIKVKLDRLVNRGDTTNNFVLEAGDLLVVPEAIF